MLETASDFALSEEFERCRPYIEAALEREFGTHTIEDVRDMVLRGMAHLWVTPGSATVTRIVDAPRNRMLCIWLAGGDLDELLRIEPQISAWAEGQCCDLVYISGRRGWLRALDGYEEGSTVMVKRL